MIFAHCRPIVQAAEAVAATGDRDNTLHVLRRLSLMDFGLLLLSLPRDDFPGISAMLPKMASVETQVAWAGSHGYDLFRNTHDFCSRLALYYQQVTGRPLENIRILDFGCGFGRVLRMLPYFTSVDRCYGFDPWDRSMAVCREDGVLGRLAQSAYLPVDLPFSGERFDLVFSYSVFSHTSPRATVAALSALRKRINPGGLLVLTVRPIEFADQTLWQDRPSFDKPAFLASYAEQGFAYFPYGEFIADGDDVYGDCVIDPSWFERACPFFRLLRYDRGVDHDQTILVFTPS